MAKDGKIDIVIGKGLGILRHAELFEPVRDLLHGGHQGPAVARLSFGPTTRKITPKKTAKARPQGRGIPPQRAGRHDGFNWASLLTEQSKPAESSRSHEQPTQDKPGTTKIC